VADSFDFRWAIISDYSNQDEEGKLMLAGVYAEDIVFRGEAPQEMPPLQITFCIAPKAPAFTVHFALIRESGEPIMRMTGHVSTDEEVGRRDRATLRLPIAPGPFPGEGAYLILLGDKQSQMEEVHRFEISVIAD
jgi:hypothetical protein